MKWEKESDLVGYGERVGICETPGWRAEEVEGSWSVERGTVVCVFLRIWEKL